MRIVEAQQTFAVAIVQRQRIIQTVRLFRGGGNPPRREFDPEITLYDKCLPVKLEESVEAVISVHSHILSWGDNNRDSAIADPAP